MSAHRGTMAAAAKKPVENALPEAPKTMAAVRFEEWMADELLAMFAELHEESPVMKLFEYNEERIKKMIVAAVMHPQNICGFACVDFTNRSIVGLMIGALGQTYFSDEPIANDVVLYMRPEYRNEFVAKQLLDAYAGWAKRLKIEKMFFTSLLSGIGQDKILKAMKAHGWKAIGSQMMKVAE